MRPAANSPSTSHRSRPPPASRLKSPASSARAAARSARPSSRASAERRPSSGEMMTRWRSLLAGIAALLFVAAPHGQTLGGRALTIAPDSAIAVRDWGTIVDRMVRGDELRVRLDRSDTLVEGRRVDQLTQYYKGLRVWGGDVARQFDGFRLISVFGTVYQGIDVDTVPAIDRDAASRTFQALGTLLRPDTEPELVVVPQDEGYRLAWVGQVMLPRDIIRAFV